MVRDTSPPGSVKAFTSLPALYPPNNNPSLQNHDTTYSVLDKITSLAMRLDFQIQAGAVASMMKALSSAKRRVAINTGNLIQVETKDISPQSSGFGEQYYFNKMRLCCVGMIMVYSVCILRSFCHCTNDSDRTNN